MTRPLRPILFLAASIALPEDAKTDDTDLLLFAASIALPRMPRPMNRSSGPRCVHRAPEDARSDDTDLLLLAASIALPEDATTDDTDVLFLAASIALPEDATTDDTDLLLLAASIPPTEDIPSVQAMRESEPVLSDKLESRASREAKKITRLMKQYQIDHLETPAVRFEFFNSAKHRYSLLFKSRGARPRAESKLAATAPLAIQTAETDLLPLATSIVLTEDIPSVVSILPSDAILTDDKLNAAVPDTTAIL
ncbi:hypothetical protein BC831DRAFT_459604, partial [Entophlyctis helioformis]